MENVNIALPDSLRDFVQSRIQGGGYKDISDYIRELIRTDQRQTSQALLEAELLTGIASGPAREITDSDWTAIKQEAKRRVAAQKSK